jgi:CHAD domain-containing protein
MRRAPASDLLIRQRLTALSRALPAAQQGDARSLHQARVASRRLREALPLVASGDRRRRLERKVRGITRALGPVRELDVALQILDELETSDVPRPAVRRLRQAVLDERRSLHRDMLRRLDRCDLDKLAKKAIAAARQQDERATAKRATPRRAAAAKVRVARRAEALSEAMATAAGLYLPDRLHEVRIAVKKLRYALEVWGAVSKARVATQIRTLKQAQELLGRMHDLEVLIARTRGVQGSSKAPSLKLSGELDTLVRRLETECRELHGHYITSRRSLQTLCDRVAAASPRRAAAA